MSDKKLFTPKEAALAVLAKAKEILQESTLAKAETGHEKGVNIPLKTDMGDPKKMGTSTGGFAAKAGHLSQAKESHKRVLGEMKRAPKPKLGKAEHMAKSGMHTVIYQSMEKSEQILEESSLAKSEKLKKDAPAPAPSGNPAAAGIMAGFNSMGMGGGGAGSTSTPMPKSEMKKYETENKKAPSKAKELPSQKLERDFKNFEVQKESPNSSGDDKRQEKQVSPSKNPKEESEGNNKPDGMEPEFEFKDKVAKELAKEKASHMVKSQSGMHTVCYQTAAIEKSEGEGDLMKAETGHEKGVNIPLKTDMGDPKKMGTSTGGFAAKAGHLSQAKESHKRVLGEMKQMPKPKLGKNENPDEKQDAELGEQVEKDVEQHFKENAAAEEQEGHELMAKPGDKVEGQSEQASIPRLILSAKLSKFMEHKHSKRKAAQGAQSQAPAAVGHDASNAPAQGSSQAGQPDNSRPKTQPTDGDVNKMQKKYEGFKAVEQSARESGASDPAAVAAAAGREKYGKEKFQHAAAEGKKMGKK